MTARGLVFAIFALIAIATAVSAVVAVAAAVGGTGSWGTACYASLKSVIASAFLVLIAIRPDARKRSRDPVAFIACALAITPGFLLQPPSGAAATGWAPRVDLREGFRRTVEFYRANLPRYVEAA